jgi:hypothetical protein
MRPIQEGPNKRTNAGEAEKTEDPHVVVGGITTAIVGDDNFPVQVKEMLAYQWNNFAPQ